MAAISEELAVMTGQLVPREKATEIEARAEETIAKIKEKEYLDSEKTISILRGQLKEVITQRDASLDEIKALKDKVGEQEETIKGLAPNVMTKEDKRRLRWMMLVGAIGYIIIIFAFVQLCRSGYNSYVEGGKKALGMPFDELTQTFRSGDCTDKRVPCVEHPVDALLLSPRKGVRGQAVSFWNSTEDASISQGLKDLAGGRGVMPSIVHTERGKANLRDLRDSMQRKLFPRGDYEFMCATFLGYPVDYCVLYIESGGMRRWVDIVGGITIHDLSFARTVTADVSVPEGLCAHAGTGQSPRHEANYFAHLCFSYADLTGGKRHACVFDRDAVVVQQLYEMQWGMLSCCSRDLDRLERIVNRSTQKILPSILRTMAKPVAMRAMDSLRLTARAMLRRNTTSVLIVMPAEPTPEENYITEAIKKFRAANPDSTCTFSLANFVNDDQVLTTIAYSRPSIVVTLGTHLMRLAVGVAAMIAGLTVESNHGCLQHSSAGYLVFPLLDSSSRCRLARDLGQVCSFTDRIFADISKQAFMTDVHKLFEMLSQRGSSPSGTPSLGA